MALAYLPLMASNSLIRTARFARGKVRIEIHELNAPAGPHGHTPVEIRACARGLSLTWTQGVPYHQSIDGDHTIASAISFLTAGQCAWDDAAERETAAAICDAAGGPDYLSMEAERFER